MIIQLTDIFKLKTRAYTHKTPLNIKAFSYFFLFFLALGFITEKYN